ncbi:MAG TPA: response regulator [Acetivibrio sp.]|uniref:response regulator n=1 Tax=Acetivibrio sp. TaxID=1872092 RepID=UPI002D1B44F6|nr:response regulator [Acetivibrio sp.]HOM03742.1 response regulator [Acetivibrio sp.]
MDGTVLLIDYSEYEREKTKIIFDNIGEYNFIEADSLKKFYTIFEDLGSITLIIMDIAFPVEKEGLEVLSAIRNNSKTANTPIIIATKSDNAGYRHAALKFKASDYILKPYSTKRLENSVRSVLKIGQRFRYEFDSAHVISMSIEDYISKEFKVASRAGQSLSVILMSPVNLKKESSEQSKEMSGELQDQIQNIAIEKVKHSLRSTDTAILNANRDILVILPFTNAPGAQKVLEKIQINVRNGLKSLNINYDDYYYAVFVTFPHDGKTFQSLMEKAVKKVEDKVMLEKITSIGVNILDNARKSYKKFNK